jgi:membrane protease YdiL (CAAX protease family)
MSGKIAAIVLAFATLLALGAGVARVTWLEAREVRLVERATLTELAEAEGATAGSVRLGRVRLAREQRVSFELCADDAMPPERWTGAMALAVWRPRGGELMTRSELTADVLAQVRRGPALGCLTIGRGVIGEDDVYAVEALFDQRPSAIADVPLTLSVQAHRPLETIDAAIVVGAWLFAIGLVASLAGWRRVDTAAPAEDLDPWEEEQAAHARGPSIPPEARVAGALLMLIAGFFLSGFFPSGAALALAAGAALALVEAAIAITLTPGPGWRRRLSLLAISQPPRAWLWFPVALVSGLVLWIIAVLATRLVPSTGESAVSTFVSWPSGLLSFACLAVLVPLAEELFFRGFVYGVLEARSRVLAFLAAWLLFVLAHAPQTWGQWGALVAILITGLALTTLRVVSRSTLVPALAHLVYNGILAVSAVL